jgi:NADPH2:quinone reductase
MQTIRMPRHSSAGSLMAGGGMTGEFNFDLHALKRIDLWPTVEAGKLSLPIYETYPLDDITAALALMRSNQHFGKVVISIG